MNGSAIARLENATRSAAREMLPQQLGKLRVDVDDALSVIRLGRLLAPFRAASGLSFGLGCLN